MALTVDYGSIAGAMGLATQAGLADRDQLQFQQNMANQANQRAAQQLANQQKATEIQQSLSQQGLNLEGQKNAATQQLAQAQMANTQAYQQGMLGIRGQQTQNLGNYQQGRVGAMQQNADTSQSKAQQMASYQEMMAQIAAQNANSKQQQVNQQGQVGQQNADTASQGMDDRSLQAEYAGLQKQAMNPMADPADPGIVAAKQRMAQIEKMYQQRNSQQQQMPRVKAQPQNQQPGSVPATAVPVTSQAQYDALPPGAYYTDANGTLAQKAAPAQPAPQQQPYYSASPNAAMQAPLPPGTLTQ